MLIVSLRDEKTCQKKAQLKARASLDLCSSQPKQLDVAVLAKTVGVFSTFDKAGSQGWRESSGS